MNQQRIEAAVMEVVRRVGPRGHSDAEIRQWCPTFGTLIEILTALLVDPVRGEVARGGAADVCGRCSRPKARDFLTPYGECYRDICPRDSEAEKDCERVAAKIRANGSAESTAAPEPHEPVLRAPAARDLVPDPGIEQPGRPDAGTATPRRTC